MIGTKKTILLVEDEKIPGIMTANVLKKQGYKVILKTDGESAVKHCREDLPVDLILMDINLGDGIDGTVAARRILKHKKVPIVFHTSHAEKDYVDRVKEITRYGYVIKKSGDFVLTSSIEMAFELFESHIKTLSSETRLNTILQSIGDGVIAADTAGNITLINPVAQRLTGWHSGEALGKPIEKVFRIIHESERTPAEDPVTRVLKGETTADPSDRVLLITKDGSEIPIDESGAPIATEEGMITGVVLVFRDQTEERHREKMVSLRFDLLEYAADHTLNELLQKVLDETGAFLNSPIGFFHFLKPDQVTLSLQAWSSKTRILCRTKPQNKNYSVQQAGVWVDCIRTGKPVIHNDYKSLPHKKELPPGHPPVIRELVVPVYRNGHIKAILGIGNKPYNYDEQDLQMASYIADVTWEIIEKKRYIEELQNNQNRLNAALHAVSMGIWEFDMHSRKVEWNGQHAALFGIKLSEFNNTVEEYLQAVHPEDRDRIVKHYEKLVAEKSNIDIAYRITKPDGSVRWMQTYGRMLLDKTGRGVKMTGTTRDITEQVMYREAYLHIFKMATEMICVADINTATFLQVNPAFTKVLGYSEEELISKPFTEFVHQDDITDTMTVIERDLRHGKPVISFTNRYRCRDGTYRWLEWNSYPIPAEGKTYAIAADVTERKEMVESLIHEINIRRKAELENRNLLQEKELLLKEVHHRIKNNMSTVINLLNLQIEEEGAPKIRSTLIETKNRIQSMQVLYDKLHRTDNFRHTSMKEYLTDLINEVVKNSEVSGNTEVITHIDSADIEISAILNLGIIINELITNAAKHALKDHQQPVLEVKVRQTPGRINLTVRDNGPGMTGSFSTGGSSGFGLRLVEALAVKSGGSFRIEQNGGNVLSVELGLNGSDS
ncbi:MAG: PAS domain S-box protein [Spirochaetia bacterium]